jgi:NADH-quinone oxidoreductase subunit L
MVTAIGMGVEGAALLHLFTHAFFKAGLFLAAGSVIHAVSHSKHKWS